MDISFISILLYIIVLLCFYIFPFGSWGNKSLTLTELTSNFDERMLAERAHSKYISLGLLVLVVTVIQFISLIISQFLVFICLPFIHFLFT